MHTTEEIIKKERGAETKREAMTKGSMRGRGKVITLHQYDSRVYLRCNVAQREVAHDRVFPDRELLAGFANGLACPCELG